MQNVLSRQLGTLPLGLFYPNSVMRHTAQSNLLSNIKIKRYSLSSSMGNPDHDAIVTGFTAILESIHYSKLKRFSNVADENPAKLLLSFRECEVLVGVPG